MDNWDKTRREPPGGRPVLRSEVILREVVGLSEPAQIRIPAWPDQKDFQLGFLAIFGHMARINLAVQGGEQEKKEPTPNPSEEGIERGKRRGGFDVYIPNGNRGLFLSLVGLRSTGHTTSRKTGALEWDSSSLLNNWLQFSTMAAMDVVLRGECMASGRVNR